VSTTLGIDVIRCGHVTAVNMRKVAVVFGKCALSFPPSSRAPMLSVGWAWATAQSQVREAINKSALSAIRVRGERERERERESEERALLGIIHNGGPG